MRQQVSMVTAGDSLNLKYRHRPVTGVISEVTMLNPNDRWSYAKRDANPIYKITVQVDELKVRLTEQVEYTDRLRDDPAAGLADLFSAALVRVAGK